MILITSYCFAESIADKVLKLGEKIQFIDHYNQVNLDDYKDCNGLILSGGGDIHPQFYNEENKGSTGINVNRDNYELMLLDWAAQNEIKVLGICRGHQLINVWAGGNLFQDFQTEIPGRGFRHNADHKVLLYNKGIKIFRGKQIDTNSLHHQAVNKLGEGIEVIGIHQSDGITESIFSAKYNMLGVQWHPEIMEGDQVFKWLIN